MMKIDFVKKCTSGSCSIPISISSADPTTREAKKKNTSRYPENCRLERIVRGDRVALQDSCELSTGIHGSKISACLLVLRSRRRCG